MNSRERVTPQEARQTSRAFPRRVSANGRYLVDAEGQPYFWLGDTAWPLFSRYARADAEAYLENRARKGFSVVQSVLVWPTLTTPEPFRITPNYAGALPWLEDDPARPDPAYFDNVDHLLNFASAADGRGITLAMLPVWGTFVTDIKLLTAENARSYGRWLGERYRSQPNIVWINGGDCLPHGFEAVFQALAGGLREGDRDSHLITYHPCGWYSSSQYFHAEEWLDFNMIQTWTDWHKTYEGVLTDSLLTPTKPVVLGEGAYEDGPEYPRGPITPLVVRRQAWWTFMAGGYYTYGHNQMWRGEGEWTQAFDSPGAGHMGVFKSIVTRYPWWQRVPDQGLLEATAGSEQTLNAAVRGADGRWGMIYLSSQCHALIRLGKLATPKVRATWVNPQNGDAKEAGVYAAYDLAGFRGVRYAKCQWFTTPDHWEDAVLVLDGVDG